MKVLVTGAAGFIGSHVVDGLRATGCHVIGLDSLDPGTWSRPPAYLRDDVDYIFADLRHCVPPLDPRLRDVEAVIHLAALGGVGRAGLEPGNVLSANAGGTARLIDMLCGMPRLQRVIVAGSFSVYGSNYQYRVPSTGRMLTAARRPADLDAGRFDVMDPDSGEVADILPITEATPPAPLEGYGASKYMQELCFRAFTAAPVTILRFSSVYGTRLRLDDGEATIIAKLAGWIARGDAPSLYEDGQQIRDWAYVGDIVDAMRAVLDTGCEWPIVNVCSGEPTTLLQACHILADVVGRAVEPKVVGGFRFGDMRHCLGDRSRLTALLGRAPCRFEDGAGRAFGELRGR